MSKNMLLVSSEWKDNQTFKLIPIDKDCPYNECIWDKDNNILAIVSKEKKDNYHFLPKLDNNGDVERAKGHRPNKQPYAEQRVLMDTYYEYFLTGETEVTEFIERFSVNDDTFEYKKYFSNPKTLEQETEAA